MKNKKLKKYTFSAKKPSNDDFQTPFCTYMLKKDYAKLFLLEKLTPSVCEFYILDYEYTC